MGREYPSAICTKKCLSKKNIVSRPAAPPPCFPALRFDGFTLLELMITITLLGVVVLIMAGALRIGARAWEKGSEKVAGIQPARVVLELMKHQLSSGLPYEVHQDGVTYPLFAGDEKQLQFVGISSLLQQQSIGNVVVTYRVSDVEDGKVLEFKEENTAALNSSSEENGDDAENWRPLSETIQDFFFQYAGGLNPDGEIIWEDTWDCRERKTLPAAVQLTMEVEIDSGAIDLVVRMPANNVTATITP